MRALAPGKAKVGTVAHEKGHGGFGAAAAGGAQQSVAAAAASRVRRVEDIETEERPDVPVDLVWRRML